MTPLQFSLMGRLRLSLGPIVVGFAACLLLGSAPASAAWKPEPAKYGIEKRGNVSVKMRDGTVLRANVFLPTDPATGKVAKGPFPVIMVQTPYGVYQVQRNAKAASYLEVPLASPSAFDACRICR